MVNTTRIIDNPVEFEKRAPKESSSFVSKTPNNDPVHLYLTDMGKIPLLTRQEEFDLGVDLLIKRHAYFKAVLCSDFIIFHTIATFKKILKQELRFDHHIDISSNLFSPFKKESSKEELLKMMPVHIKTLSSILKRNRKDFRICISKDSSKKEKVAAYKRIVRRRHAAAKLILELKPRLRKVVEPAFEKLIKQNKIVLSLKEKLKSESKRSAGYKTTKNQLLQSVLAYNDSPLMMAKHVEHCLKLKNDYDSVKQKLSAGNLRLVVSIAKKYRNKGLSFLDLIQEGNAKLPHAAEKFDITRGFRFTTYASYWIKQSIKKALADTSREIRIPVHMIDTVNKVNKAIENLQMELRREPSNEEISKKTRLTISEVEAVKKYIRPPISINQKIGKNDSTLGDLLESYEAPSLRSVLPEDYENLKIAINEVLKTLPYRQREILRLLYGLGNNSDSLTLEEVGTIFKVTRERIRQLEAKAIRMLQQPSRSSQLVGFLS